MSISQLQPQKNFAFVRQLPDPSDSSTYYVQAEIRYAENDTLIRTLNLTDRGNRRFVGIWQAIADSSGQGTLISVRTTVYTDSGYTNPSTTYMQEMETYLVLQQFNPREIVSILGPALYAASGEGVNYKKIAKIFRDILEEKLQTLKIDVIEAIRSEKVSLDHLAKIGDINALRALVEEVAGEIKDAVPRETDLSPLKDMIFGIREGFGSDFRKVQQELGMMKPDLTPVMKMIATIQEGSIEHQKNVKLMIDSVLDSISEINFTPNNEDQEEKLEEIKNSLEKIISLSPEEEIPEIPKSQVRSYEIIGAPMPKEITKKNDFMKRATELIPNRKK